jgi:NAD(P)-dependent dehydrogenase (short-subunit alcohol dehydrogenase family)
MQRLLDQRIVLTGVSRGVGFEIARLFLAEGAQILGVARDPQRLAALPERLGPLAERLTTVACDLEDPSAAGRVRAAVERRWDGLDLLWNNAGIQIDQRARGLSELPEGVVERALYVNLMAPYYLCLALLPLLLQGNNPRIVNTSSGAGNMESMRSSDIPSYRLSKWALNGLTMLLAAELQGRVAVNAFDPGWVKTDLGGPHAPGSPAESAQGALALATLATTETGNFYKDGAQIPF